MGSMTQGLGRRDFLVRSGVLAGTALAFGACKGEELPVPPSDPAEGKLITGWEGVRAQFDLDPDYLHFAAPVLAAHPRAVRDAIERHRAELDRNTKRYLYSNETQLDADVLEAATSYFGGGRDAIALTDSTTMGLGLLYGGIKVRDDQEILTTDHDFYATHETLRLRASRSALSWRKISLFDDHRSPDAEEIVERIGSALTRRTRVLALTWVHSSTGVKLPIRGISDRLSRVNADRDEEDRVLLCVDSVHAAGVLEETPIEAGCDFLVTGCHKWLFGPRGTGLVWGSPAGWAATTATIPTFDGRSYIAWLQGTEPTGLPPSAAMTPGGFHSFEHRWALVETFSMHQELGRRAIAEHVYDLATRLKEGLAEIGGVELETPMSPEVSAGIVCFSVGHQPAEQVVERLEDEFHVMASVTPYDQRFVRLMTSIATGEDEVDEVLLAVRAIA